MKKILLLLTLLPLMASAYDAKIDGMYYNLNKQTKQAAITYEKASGDTPISSYSGSVTVPQTVTYNNVSYSVTSVGEGAFYGCTGLTSITLPNSITEIGQGAFYSCSGLTTVTIPDNVNKIDEYTFYSCSGLTSVEIPNSVKDIDEGAFTYCSSLTSVTIGNSVTSIGNAAFRGCSSLTSVTIPNSVTSISSNAFRDCSNLTSVTIPNSVKGISSNAFTSCSSLTEVYCYMENITSSSASSNSFSGASIANATLYVPEASLATYKTTSPWSGFGNFVAISDPEAGNIIKCDVNGIYYILNTKTKLATVTSGETKYTGSVSISSTVTYGDNIYNVTTIGEKAFYDCYELTSVTIPNSVTSIGESAFWGCSGLKSITIPNSVTSIENYAFNSCTKLSSITLSSSLKTIGDHAFYGCSNFYTITIPNSVTSIGEDAFSQCSKMTSVVIPNSVTSLGKFAFEGCSGLKTITIGESVTSIEAYTFSGCPMTSITIPNSVTSIGQGAFSDCSKLTTITIPSSVTKIGTGAFQNCSILSTITLPSSIISIGSNAFDGTAWYNNQPDGLTYIGNYVYKYKGTMSSNTSISIEEGTLGIAKEALYNNYYLVSVTIPQSVKWIDQLAFKKCTNLREVYCYAVDVPATYYNNAFEDMNLSKDTLYVYGVSANAYRTKIPWSKFGKIVAIGDEPEPPYIAINETNFPDENFRNWILSQTYGVDSKLTDDEISSVTTINVDKNNIKNLQGIEIFTALKSLKCDNNSLTSLDISKLPALEEISCCHNGLISLDVSANTALRIIKCSYNSLSSLDLSHNPYLYYLMCDNNQLASLDLSKNNALTMLACPNNQLTSLNVSGCTALSVLLCYCNQLKDAAMDAFIESLPTVSNGDMYVIFNENEGNIMTTTQVAAAKAKGWNVKYTTDGNTFIDYDGSTPEADDVVIYKYDGICYSLNTMTKLATVTYEAVEGNMPKNSYSGSVTIPKTVTYNNEIYNVISVGEGAFYGCTGLTSVTLPNSIIEIGYGSFALCSGLTSITIPSSVETIGEEAFARCSGLTNVTIPNSVRDMGDGVFGYCSELTSITLSDNVKSLGGSLFKGCSKLTSIIIPDGVRYIGTFAFYDCASLTSVTIPNGVTTIGNKAFYGCLSLAEVYCYIEEFEKGLAGSAFNSEDISDATLYVHKASLAKYKTTEPWSWFGAIKSIDGDNIYIETDITGQFPTDWQGWNGATGYTATQFAPIVETNDGRRVQVCERYNDSSADKGTVFYRTLTGLTNGTYRIELYGAAASTKGRDTYISSDMTENDEGDVTAVYLYAKTARGTVKQYIPVHWATSFSSMSTAVLNGVEVTNGTVEIGMYSDKEFTNWHVVQIKGMVALVDAEDLYANVLQAAQTALADATYANVVGEERTALKRTVKKYSTVTECTAEAYQTAINALVAATTLFTDAKNSYDEWGQIRTQIMNLSYPYASAEKRAAAENAAAVYPTNAADAVSKTESMILLFRRYAESSALLEGVNGATNMTSYIKNPRAESAINISEWQTELGSDSGGSITILNNQPWTDGSGNSFHSYFDGGSWESSTWDIIFKQNVTLPAGRYQLTVIGRSSDNVEQTLFVDDYSVNMPHINNVGGLFDRGWEQTSLEFELSVEKTVKIGVRGVANAIHNWMSFSDFRLVQFPGSEPEVKKCATPTIINLNGKLMFYCETEDVKYDYSVVLSVEGSDQNITLPKTCKISVIATKEGYEPSDPFMIEVDMSYLIGKLGDVNKDGVVNGTDIQEIINIIVNTE